MEGSKGAADPLPRVLVASLAGVVLGLAAAGLFALQSGRRAREEFETRAAILPKAFAVANANAIIRGDLAALRVSIETLFKGPVAEEAGLLYVVVLDPDGNALATAYADNLPGFNKALIDGAMRVGGADTEAAAEVSDDRRTARERLGIEEGGGKTGGEARPYRPVTQYRLTRLEAGAIRYLDVAVPVVLSNTNWGAIRMGFRDSIAEAYLGRLGAFVATVLFSLVGAAFLALFVSRGLSDRIGEALEAERATLTRRFEKVMAEVKAVEAPAQEAPLQAQEFFGLLDAAKDLGASLDEEEILQTAVRLGAGLLHARDVSIFLIDQASHTLVGRIGHGEGGLVGPEVLSQVTIQIGHGEIGMAAEFGTTAVIDEPRPGSGVVSALIARGQTLGVLLARNKSSGRPFLKRDRLIARLLAQFTANALSAARAYRAVYEGAAQPGA